MAAQATNSSFFNQDLRTGQINCQIETENLILVSLDNEKHQPRYVEIFGNKDNFENYASGNAWDVETTARRVDRWHQRWMKGNPFSALVITRKKDGQVIGHFVAGNSGKPGISSLGFMIDKPFQNQGYGTETANALKEQFLPQLLGRKVGDATLTAFEATSKASNVASCKLLETHGFVHVKDEEAYGSERRVYQFKV